MTCATIMTANPVSVRDHESIANAAKTLVKHGYINLPVVDAQGKFVGMFGIYDLLALLVPRVAIVGHLLPNLRFLSDDLPALHAKYEKARNLPVGRAANREPASVNPDTPIIEAVRLFCRNHTTLPVLERESGRLVGIISYWDAMRAIIEEPK